MKKVDVTTQIVIIRPREEVTAFSADPDNAPKWYKNIKSVVWRTPKPLSVGSQIAFRAVFLGRQLEYVYEIVEWVRDIKMVMRTSNGPFPMETTYTWQTVEVYKTLMTLRNAGRPAGFSRILAPFIARAMRKANEKDLQRLKILLENS